MRDPQPIDKIRLLPVGTAALLVELATLDQALALFATLQSAPPEGVIELLPAARTVLLRFNPAQTSPTILAQTLRQTPLHPLETTADMPILTLPVSYDGADLPDIADHLGLTVAEVIRRHSEALYTVAFCGFAPGFAYMVGSDPLFDLPRRASPRPKIPAGSVALAGRFCGIYPSDSPGGWQLLGRTNVPMWQSDRSPPAALSPAQRLRFEPATGPLHPVQLPEIAHENQSGTLHVIRADRPVSLQDLGRLGQSGIGLSPSGALDQSAFISANLCLGNPLDTPALELLYGGLALTTEQPATLALTGAPAPMTIRKADGTRLPAPNPVALDAGETLEIGAPSSGVASYLALRGGFVAPKWLGSASYDSLAKLGPPPLATGTRLAAHNAPARAITPLISATYPRSGEIVQLDLHLGPRADWFAAEALALLTEQLWTVTPATSRIGARLEGALPLTRQNHGELPSEGLVRGALQVPHAGQPVLFLADHPVTGGYPVIAVIAPHHLDLAAQTPIGARMRFTLTGAKHA